MGFAKDIKIANKRLVIAAQRLPERLIHFAVVNDVAYGIEPIVLR